MTRPEIELPDDVEALKAMVLAMAAKAARVEALEKQVDDLERVRFNPGHNLQPRSSLHIPAV